MSYPTSRQILYNGGQIYAVVCWLCAVGKLRIGAVMLSLRFFTPNFNRSYVFCSFLWDGENIFNK